jgi:hypothetical protein
MSDEQSASMGSIDDDVDKETMIPMKNPAITNDGDDPDSFLDDDFLSFANHNNGGQHFDRPDPSRYSAPGAEKPAIIPWMTILEDFRVMYEISVYFCAPQKSRKTEKPGDISLNR